MISSNALPIYLLHHNQNDFCDQNLCSIQKAMRLEDPAGSKFKRVCTYFPNTEVPTNITMPGDIQVLYAHMSVGKNSLGETVAPFS